MIQIDMKMPETCSECEFEDVLYRRGESIYKCYILRIEETDAVRKHGRLPSCPLIDAPENNVVYGSETLERSTDCISRQAAINIAKDLLVEIDEYHQYNQAISNYCVELMKLPSSQPEIIRCNECIHKYYYSLNNKRIYCTKHGCCMYIDDYYSYGEIVADEHTD